MRSPIARWAKAHADCFNRACRFRRTQIPRPAHRYRTRRRRLLHEAADIGHGGGTRQIGTALRGPNLTQTCVTKMLPTKKGRVEMPRLQSSELRIAIIGIVVMSKK